MSQHRSPGRLPGFKSSSLPSSLSALTCVAVGMLVAGASISVSRIGLAQAQTQVDSADMSPGEQCRPGASPDYDKVRSLEEIFDVVANGLGGEIIRAELAQRSFVSDCIWVYDVKLLSEDGNVTKVAYDAEDLRLIGFSRPATVSTVPVVTVGPTVSVAPRTSSKTLNDPDADGVADSGNAVESGAGADTAGETASAAADTADAATDSADATDDGQRDGRGTNDNSQDGSTSAADSDQSSDANAASDSGDASAGNASSGAGSTAN